MTTTSADEKSTEANPTPGAILDPDEADRFAALIKPAWEADEAAAGASAPATSTRPSDDGRPTAIDPIPTVDVGDTLPTDGPPIIDADALVASVEPTPPKSKGPPPAPSARPGSTRMGLGNDVELASKAVAAAEAEKAAAPAGATRMGIGHAAELAAEGAAELAGGTAEPDEDLIATQARPVASVPPSAGTPPRPPRPAAGVSTDRSSSAAPAAPAARPSYDDPIELPMNRAARGGGSMGLGIGIGLGIAAVVGLGIFFVARSGDDAKPAPTPAATTAAAKVDQPEIKPPPIPAEEPAKAEPSKADPPKEEPKEEPKPPSEEPKADPPKEEPKPEAKADPPKGNPPSGGGKPPSGGGKPPAPPGGGKPKGGIIRDAPF